MKKEDFFELIGDIDEEKVRAAESAPTKKRKARLVMTGLSVAACAGIIIGAVVWSGRSDNTALKHNESSTENESNTNYNENDSDTAIDLEYDDISIYYIKDGELKSETEYLPCSPKDIFEVWKKKNGIGDDVALINVKIENNGTEKVDSLIASYTVGDRFIYNLTVTANLKDYFDTLPKEKLEKSLELTLTSYNDMEFDEFNIIYE